MPSVYKLKVKQTDVGKKTPFPLVYIFPFSLLDQMRQAFDSLIGFTARHHVNIDWKTIKINQTVSGVTRTDTTTKNEPLEKLIPDLLREDDPWQVAVPILNRNRPPSKKKYARKNNLDPRDLYAGQVDYSEDDEEDEHSGKPVLGYLKDKKWSLRPENGTPVEQRAYPSTAYLATKEKVYPTVCAACPRYIFHQAGKCMVGDKVCFETLRDYFAPNMFKKLREYDVFLETLEE